MKLRRKISVRPSTRHCSCANTIMIDVGGCCFADPVGANRITLFASRDGGSLRKSIRDRKGEQVIWTMIVVR
jgi:hypothetical protein